MRRVGGAVAAAALAALAGPAGCGTKGLAGDHVPGHVLTIYSSVPLHGASRVNAEAVVRGAELALAQVHGRIGMYSVAFKPLDDSTIARAGWDPGQTTLNARLAVADRTTIGYLGEFNSGASAVSIPVLNRAGIPQISPASSAVGLTSGAAGASPGEPQKYYPTGSRNFARVVPSDAIEAVAQVSLQRSAGCTNTYVLDDGEVDGLDTATSFVLAARAAGLPVVGFQAFDPRATDYGSLAAGVAQTGANCVLISAITEDNAALVTKQIATALPKAKIFGSAGLAESTFTDPSQGGIPAAVDPRVLITAATLGGGADTPAARELLKAYARRYGPPQPYAIFGYEAMSLLLSAIARATENGTEAARRSSVVGSIFATRNRRSVLGTYSIDHGGDTTLHLYGVYRVRGGHLEFWRTIDA